VQQRPISQYLEQFYVTDTRVLAKYAELNWEFDSIDNSILGLNF